LGKSDTELLQTARHLSQILQVALAPSRSDICFPALIHTHRSACYSIHTQIGVLQQTHKRVKVED